MLLRALLPATILGLAIWGMVSLIRCRKADTPAAPARACAGCGRASQTDRTSCPYCGKPLA